MIRGTISNISLQAVRDRVREVALADFWYYCTTVYGFALEESFADDIVALIDARQDALIEHPTPRRFAEALRGWLLTRGITVISDLPDRQHDWLTWLGLDGTGVQGLCVLHINVTSTTLSLTWAREETVQ